MSANDPRLTFFLDDQDNRSLKVARTQDGLPASDRIRAAVQLWMQGGSDASRIDRLAADRRQARQAHTPSRERTKLSLDLGTDRLRALALARVEDGVPAAERVRAALQLWEQDPAFRAQVDELAAELRRTRRSSAEPTDPVPTADPGGPAPVAGAP